MHASPNADEGFELIVRQAKREFMGSTERRQPVPFYHYTSAAGLKGILETEAIWATDCRFLNDPEELSRGEDATQAEFDALIQGYSDETITGHLCRRMEGVRQGNHVVDLINRDGIGIYVTSFSSEPSLLGQWRAYADDAAGYAIGFNSIPLPTAYQSQDDPASELGVDFGPCYYRVDEYRARVREVILVIADGFEKYLKTYCRNELQAELISAEAGPSGLSKLAAMVPFLKDPAHAEEKEWRLVFYGTPPVKLTRETRYGVASYFEMSLKKGERMHLHEIIAGPRAGAKGLEFARTTAERCGYGDIRIVPSRVPYR